MIKVSTRGEYGTRVMVELGRHFGRGPLSLGSIATEAGLPLDYLEHLITPLRKAGLVKSTRGLHGGYALARPPHEIVMGEVIRLLEGPIAPMICTIECEDRTAEQWCERESSCTTKFLWLRLRDSVAQALDSTTLVDLMPRSPAVAPPAHKNVATNARTA